MFSSPWNLLDREKKLAVKRESNKDYYIRNKERSIARTSAYIKKNRKKFSDYCREYRRDPEHNRVQHIASRRWQKQNDMKYPSRYKFRKIREGAARRGIDFKFSRDEFEQWFNGQEKICFYCRIDEFSLKKMPYFKNHLTMSVDRIDSSLGYQPGNVLITCYKCNACKSNYIPHEAMLEIGEKYLMPQWKNKLGVS